MFQWAKARIEDGPDPRNGALTHAELSARLGADESRGKGWAGRRRSALFEGIIAPSTRPFQPSHQPRLCRRRTESGGAWVLTPCWAQRRFSPATGMAARVRSTRRTRAIHWLAGLAGFSSTAGGVFVSGGTLGNLSALHAARVRYQALARTPARALSHPVQHPSPQQHRGGRQGHGRRIGSSRLRRSRPHVVPSDAREQHQRLDGIFAIVANAGATNSGAVDDIAALADVAAEHGHLAARRRRLWLGGFG